MTDSTVNDMIDECMWEVKNENVNLKKQNPNYFYNHEKVSKSRKRKYNEYLKLEYGYEIRREEDVRRSL